MKNMLGWLIAGVGAYYLYEKYYSSGTVVGTPIQPGTSTTQNTQNTQTSISSSNPPVVSVNPTPGVQISSNASDLVAKLQSYLVNNGKVNDYHNIDEWNYFFQASTGVPGPAMEDVGIAVRNTQMNSSSYSNLMRTWLSTGKASINGLGRIIAAQTYGVPTNRLYMNQAGIPDRPTIVPNGFEYAVKRLH